MIRRIPRSVAPVLVLAVTLLGGACGDDDTRPAAQATSSTVAKPSGDITVLAAASVTDAFTEIGKAFEAANPGTHVKFSFDSSSTLASQANSGAPADVFASADDANMKKVTDAGNGSDARTFARNRLAILVQKGNPKKVAQLADLGHSDVIYVLCAATVPCGNYGQQALDRAGVTRAPASFEANVKGVVTKVTSGQADAGIVYVTDARAVGDKGEGVYIPDNQNVVASYPVAVLKQAAHADVARAFVDYLLSPKGQAVLATYGFLPAA